MSETLQINSYNVKSGIILLENWILKGHDDGQTKSGPIPEQDLIPFHTPKLSFPAPLQSLRRCNTLHHFFYRTFFKSSNDWLEGGAGDIVSRHKGNDVPPPLKRSKILNIGEKLEESAGACTARVAGNGEGSDVTRLQSGPIPRRRNHCCAKVSGFCLIRKAFPVLSLIMHRIMPRPVDVSFVRGRRWMDARTGSSDESGDHLCVFDAYAAGFNENV